MAAIGHIAVGLAAGRAWAGRAATGKRLGLALGAFVLLSVLPDLDVVAFSLGIPYHHPLGHRGASHAPATALALGALVALAGRRWGLAPLRTFVAVSLTVASHGVLDALTDGGLGVAFLWPLDDRRFFFPWRPLQVAPIGLDFLGRRGLEIAVAETIYFSPLLLFTAWPRRRGPAARP